MVLRYSLIAIAFLYFVSGAEGYAADHWERPLAPQTGWKTESLHPGSCGKCHPAQFEGWRKSRHSMAGGPGLIAQLNPEGDPSFAQSCLRCHAPLAEQAKVRLEAGKYNNNGSYDEDLLESGITCSGCHLRNGKLFGPPPNDSPPVKTTELKGEGKHGKRKAVKLFASAKFCAACHQLDDGYSLNGKPLTNTYQEWKESKYAELNIPCQSCHMPDRRHEWRGIHDKEMTKQAVDMSVNKLGAGYQLTVTNIGAGHFFPTYVTPLIVVQGFTRDSKGEKIAGSEKKGYIGRKVTLDLTTEEFDTRIPPGKSFTFDYTPPKNVTGDVVIELTVHPDQFYRNFFEAALTNESMGLHKIPLRKVVDETRNSPYQLKRFVISQKKAD